MASILVAILFQTGGVSGQRLARLELEARAPEGFGFVGSIRPLSDGRVAVADPLGQVLVFVTLDTQTADTIGRVGSGPQEYRNPDGVFPLPGDSTLLVDLGNGRLTVVDPEGVFVRQVPIVQETAEGRLTMVLPRFVDSRGRLYIQTEQFGGVRGPDSATIVRLDMPVGKVDTIAAVRLAGPARQSARAGVILGQQPLGPKDDWAVAADGRVAVIRAEDYSVHWIGPGSRIDDGPPTPFTGIPIGRAEKDAWVEEFFDASISMTMRRSADGQRDVRLSRGSSGRMDLDIDRISWPSRLPPFRPGRSIVAPTGELWVQRYGRVGRPVTIDVFDAHGQKTGEVPLPDGRRVAGFGADVIYLLHTDESGLQWLERYRMERRDLP